MLISQYLQANSTHFPEQNCRTLVRTFGYSRGVLPHLSFEKGMFFITTRLHDSVPSSVITTMRQELGLCENVFKDKDELQISPQKKNALLELWKRIQSYEDAGHGQCLMRIPMIANMVVESLKQLAPGRYDLLAWSVMPNHLHFLIRLLGIDIEKEEGIRKQLGNILRYIKGSTAFKANQMLGRGGEPFWQKEYFDRYIRSEQHLRNVVKYIVNNPRVVGVSSEYTGTIFDDIL